MRHRYIDEEQTAFLLRTTHCRVTPPIITLHTVVRRSRAFYIGNRIIFNTSDTLSHAAAGRAGTYEPDRCCADDASAR